MVFVVVFVCVHYVTRVILRVVRLPIIIVDLSMVVALIVKYLRNGLVMTVGALVFLHSAKISKDLFEIMGHHSPLQW